MFYEKPHGSCVPCSARRPRLLSLRRFLQKSRSLKSLRSLPRISRRRLQRSPRLAYRYADRRFQRDAGLEADHCIRGGTEASSACVWRGGRGNYNVVHAALFAGGCLFAAGSNHAEAEAALGTPCSRSAACAAHHSVEQARALIGYGICVAIVAGSRPEGRQIGRVTTLFISHAIR